jgi:rod shape-determining protein MreB
MTARTAKAETLHVGIDLGTSRSAVAGSNGARHVVDSYVGWPLDMVARKVVKKSILFGREALDNRTMLDLHRPLERGLIKEGSEKDEKAVRELLGHLIELAGAKEDSRVFAVVGVPAEALRASKQNLRNAVRGLAESLMIVSEPFAVAYGMDALLHTMIVDIGAGTTDFCVMNGHYPTEEEQRTLTNAGDSIDEQLMSLLHAAHPEARFSIYMVRDWKEKFGFVGEPANPVKVSVPVGGKPTEIDITAELKRACESILPPVVETMLDLVARVDPEFQDQVRANVVLAGGGSLISGLPAALEKALSEMGGGKVRAVEDPAFAGATGGLAIALDAPETDWESLPG